MDQCLKIEAFTIDLESELLIRTGPIMKKNMFDRKDSGVREV